ncbi:MAG: SH3 domain-containing protein [Anaerolinea sp.]|nr:SH3 domain-containing protein [Anaerolinea sp.]
MMRSLRFWLMFTILSLSVGAPILAQTPVATPPPAGSATVTVTLVTGADGSTGDLLLQLAGTFPGAPIMTTLALPGDLTPGATNIYSFLVGYDFCSIFQYRLELTPGTTDSWTGVVQTIAINDIPVWTNFEDPFTDPDVTPLNPGGFKGGMWDRTAAYIDRCGQREFTLRTVTGPGAADGTANPISLHLTGPFSASPYRIFIANPGTLVPGSNVIQRFNVPMRFCDVTGWRLQLAGDPADTWNIYAVYMTFDAVEVFFDNVFYQIGPLSVESARAGTWNETAAYQTRCAPGNSSGIGSLPGVIDPALVLTVGPFVDPSLLVTPGLVIDPSVLSALVAGKGATPTPNLPVVDSIVLQPTLSAPNIAQGAILQPTLAQTPVPQGQAGGQAITCPGFLPSRLIVGGTGRVTPGTPNRLRAQPATSAPAVGTIPGGAQFQVLAGPQCDPVGIAWWQVNYNGTIGWTAEGQGSTYFVEPVSP